MEKLGLSRVILNGKARGAFFLRVESAISMLFIIIKRCFFLNNYFFKNTVYHNIAYLNKHDVYAIKIAL